MPCRYDEPEPSTRQSHLQRSAKLLMYVLSRLGREIPSWVEAQAKDRFARDERCVTELCALLTGLDDQARDALVYDARDREARDLADWWEDHQKEDAARRAREAEEARRERLRAKAMGKLTPEERRALGLK